MDFSKYLFRASAIGKIVTKSGKLTDGAKTYLSDLFIGEIYKTREEAYGKALEKGIFCEEDGISMIQNTLLRGQLVVKNKEERHNDYVKGSCDVDKNGVIYDVKNAYTLFSFGKADLTHDYEWQLMVYCWLWGRNKAVLYYCLNNLPEHMLEDEKRKLLYTNKWLYLSEESPNYIEACNELESAHNYDHMPIEERFKFWEIEATEERFEMIKKAVIEARKYLQKLWEEHQALIRKNKSAMGIPYFILAELDSETNTIIIT